MKRKAEQGKSNFQIMAGNTTVAPKHRGVTFAGASPTAPALAHPDASCSSSTLAKESGTLQARLSQRVRETVCQVDEMHERARRLKASQLKAELAAEVHKRRKLEARVMCKALEPHTLRKPTRSRLAALDAVLEKGAAAAGELRDFSDATLRFGVACRSLAYSRVRRGLAMGVAVARGPPAQVLPPNARRSGPHSRRSNPNNSKLLSEPVVIWRHRASTPTSPRHTTRSARICREGDVHGAVAGASFFVRAKDGRSIW
jgi:hypothetical protein